MNPNTEVYPRAPLTEVVFEIRFPGEPAVECQRHEFFEVVRKELPVVRVPELQAKDKFKFRVYQFASADDSQCVMVGINLLAYSQKRYAGFEDFRSKLEPIFDSFVKRFKLGPMRRVGLRYINVIPFAREAGSVPLGRFLNSQFALSPKLPQAFDGCSIGFVTSLPTGQIVTRIETMKDPRTGEETLLLDFDFFKTDNLNAASVIEYLEESHQHTKAFFEGIITDQYREFIRGKPLG